MEDTGDKLLGAVVFAVVAATILGIVFALYGLVSFGKNFGRHQKLLDEQNQVQVNDIQISQTVQLVKVQQQKAQIKIEEAKGIAEAQKIINQSLTTLYLQHEAIQAQESMANSPNHTTIYIPSGQNGIPLVGTVGGN